MSVFIPGMEMPSGCHECNFHYITDGETNEGEKLTVVMCSTIQQGTAGKDYDGSRPSWCPLVEVKPPHGRLIDADALYRNDGKDEEGFYCQIVYDWDIEEAPTIIEAEGGENDE